eukprot:SAG31_NODE_28111_length_415_cov_0.930380_1_plen_47_part_01
MVRGGGIQPYPTPTRPSHIILFLKIPLNTFRKDGTDYNLNVRIVTNC